MDVVPTDPVPTAMLDISFTAHLPDCLEMPYLPEIQGAKKMAVNTDGPPADLTKTVGANGVDAKAVSAKTGDVKTGDAEGMGAKTGSRQNGEGKHVYQLGGLTCLAGDRLGNYAFEAPLKPGDRLVFEDMMHYTTVKTLYFNGVAHPSLGMWTQNNTFELWREFRYEDYRDRLG